MKTGQDFLDYVLMDDETPYGGTSFSNETLKDFLESIDEPLDSPMDVVNEWLIESGIKQIKID